MVFATILEFVILVIITMCIFIYREYLQYDIRQQGAHHPCLHGREPIVGDSRAEVNPYDGDSASCCSIRFCWRCLRRFIRLQKKKLWEIPAVLLSVAYGSMLLYVALNGDLNALEEDESFLRINHLYLSTMHIIAGFVSTLTYPDSILSGEIFMILINLSLSLAALYIPDCRTYLWFTSASQFFILANKED